jgi:hypothetical protein
MLIKRRETDQTLYNTFLNLEGHVSGRERERDRKNMSLSKAVLKS